LDPRQFSALFQIGLAAFEAGDLAEARILLQRFLNSAPEAAFGEPRRVAQRLLQELEPATPGS
jgi:cytochrome c-type biogenesis protein CcmH/NrfG